MKNIATLLYVVVLFVVLTPGILLRLPPKGSPLVVAIVHGAVFAIVLYLTHRTVHRLSVRAGLEGFATCKDGSMADAKTGKCKDGSKPGFSAQ